MEPPIPAGQGTRVESRRAGHQQQQGCSMMQTYGAHIVFGWFGIWGLFRVWGHFVLSEPSADNGKHEGEIK